MTKSRGILSPRVYWTDDHLAQLRERYPNEKTEAIAKDLVRKLHTVYCKAHALGLHKSAQYLCSQSSGRTNGKQGIGTRFTTGHPTWNKGMKGLDIGGHATRFKPGQKPQTWRPIGSERFSKDGYLQRKVTDTGYPPRDWVGVHILTWIGHHGPVPAGHVVVFKDGDKQNRAIGNLECISRADLMRRNTRHNLPKELSNLMQLRGALNRQINRRMKNEQ